MDFLRHLSFFLAVAEEGHFGKAAARLGITQPPLSQGLRRLEETLNVELIERSPKGAILTDAGRQLLPRARLLVADAERFRSEARALEPSPDLTVRWGATTLIDDALLTRCVRELRATGGRVVTQTGTTANLIGMVCDGHLDAAVVEHPALLAGLSSGPIVKLSRWVVVPADHVSATADQPRVRMLRDLEFATLTRVGNPPSYDLLLESLQDRGLDPAIAICADARELLTSVASGRCFAITTTPPATLPGVAWIRLLHDTIGLRVRVVWRRDSDASPITAALDRVLYKARR